MFTIKNMIPEKSGSTNQLGALISSLPYDAYQCDSYSLMYEVSAECDHKTKVLQLLKEHVVTNTVTVYERCFIMNDNGKTIDTIFA